MKAANLRASAVSRHGLWSCSLAAIGSTNAREHEVAGSIMIGNVGAESKGQISENIRL
jgi:hypothetical protein